MFSYYRMCSLTIECAEKVTSIVTGHSKCTGMLTLENVCKLAHLHAETLSYLPFTYQVNSNRCVCYDDVTYIV